MNAARAWILASILAVTAFGAPTANAEDTVKTIKENPGMAIGAGTGAALGGPAGAVVGAGIGVVADNVSKEVQRFFKRIKIRL